MKKLTLSILMFCLTACGASQGQIETAIAQTQTVKPTVATATIAAIEPSSTSAPTATVAPIDTAVPPTGTPTLQPSPTPDTRLIVGDPEDYILQKADLPDRYVLKPDGSTPHLNSEVIGVRGAEDGKAYLEATGRIGGWIIWYRLADTKAIAPDWVESYIVIYSKLEGPSLALSEKWNPDYYDQLKRGDIVAADPPINVGDMSHAYYIRKRQASGKYFVQYTIDFTYRNVLSTVYGEGLESNVTPDYMASLAEISLEKLKAAPLRDSVP